MVQIKQMQNLPVHDEKNNSDISHFMKFTEHWEGRRHTAYTDRGAFAIGVGHHFKNKNEFSGKLTDKQIDELLKRDMTQAIIDAKQLVKNFDSLPYKVKLIVADLSFNLGKNNFSKFKKAIHACHNRDWEKMAFELKNSKWYGQVNRRSKHHVTVLQELAQDEKMIAKK